MKVLLVIAAVALIFGAFHVLPAWLASIGFKFASALAGFVAAVLLVGFLVAWLFARGLQHRADDEIVRSHKSTWRQA